MPYPDYHSRHIYHAVLLPILTMNDNQVHLIWGWFLPALVVSTLMWAGIIFLLLIVSGCAKIEVISKDKNCFSAVSAIYFLRSVGEIHLDCDYD